jgi:hypothetical protein
VSRRFDRARQSVALRFTLAAVLALAAAGSFAALRSSGGVAAAPQAAPPSLRLVRQLVRAAEKPGSDVRRLTHDGWRFAWARRRGLTCWVLIAPSRVHDGTCGRDAEVKAQPFLVYSQVTPAAAVVYGVVSPAVRALRLVLSDCSILRVGLSSRPLFWSFVPRRKLRAGARPVRLQVRFRAGRTVETSLARGRGGCRRRF